ncbi:MAG: hypothetical protein SO157_02760 [Bullifex sp.]|nr:hypothetical protein [Bullifex sp.]
MATANTFTIDNLKTLIKIWMIERRELLKEEKKVCSYRVMEGEDSSAKKPEYDYEETWNQLMEFDDSIRSAKHTINSFSVSHYVPEYNMTLDELEMYLEDLDRRFNTLKELGAAHPIKRTIVNRSVRHTIANYDLKQARKDCERLDDERRKVRSIISEIKESEAFENEYFGIELDADETLSDCFNDYHDYIMDYEGKLSDDLIYGIEGEWENEELEKEMEEFLRKIRE